MHCKSGHTVLLIVFIIPEMNPSTVLFCVAFSPKQNVCNNHYGYHAPPYVARRVFAITSFPLPRDTHMEVRGIVIDAH